jgi:hypothetical protein
MCPVCFTTAGLIAVSVVSTGGLAAIAIRKFGMKNIPENNAPDRRNEDVSQHN